MPDPTAPDMEKLVEALRTIERKAVDGSEWNKKTRGKGDAHNDFAEIIQVARSALAKPAALPKGEGDWVLVPREPTRAMISYGPYINEINPAVPPITESQADAAWSAMIDAAPQPPALSTQGMREALEELKSRRQQVITSYERNGPQWTSDQGSKMYDASYVVEAAREDVQFIDEALASLKTERKRL